MDSTALHEVLLDLGIRDGEDPFLDWQQVFGNDHPVELELGIGKGRFILATAQVRPQVNFVGIEWAVKYLRLAHDRCQKRQLTNVRLVHADAREFVEECVPAGSISAVHLYFPDPWPKKRHHKRRLFTPEFLREVERLLQIGGRFWVATDHEEYFQVIQEVLSTSQQLREIDEKWSEVKTNYEEKYLAIGKEIYRRVLEKAP